MNAITALPLTALHANAYNPNVMTAEEFAELVAEVRHLGRLPKPVVVRANAEGFQIIDGEHGWRAAGEAGLVEVSCEVIEADDFEAMRQTYKRNQHGKHNPVLQGLMFRRMMTESGLSQRELATSIDLSEGTVRNSLEYVKALETLPAWLEAAKQHIYQHEFSEECVRKGYALLSAVGLEAEPEEARNGYALWIERLSTRQARLLNRLPAKVAGLWLLSGADVRDLFASASDPSEHAYTEDAQMRRYHEWAPLFELIDKGGGWMRTAADFLKMRRHVLERRQQMNRYTMGSFTVEQLVPYFLRYWDKDFYVRDEYLFESVLKEIIDKSAHPAKFILTPEEWEAVFIEQHKAGGNSLDFKDRLKFAVFRKLGSDAETFKGCLKLDILRYRIEHLAPDYIKNSKLKNLTEIEALWDAEGPDWKKENLAQFEVLPWDWRRQLSTAEEDKTTAAEPKSAAEAIIEVVLAYMQENGIALPEESRTAQVEKLNQCHDAVLLALFDVLKHRYSMLQLGSVAAILCKVP